MRDHTLSEDAGRWFLNGRLTLRRSADDGADGLSIAEHLMARGDSPPLHLHHDEDEIFHILEGEVRFRVGEAEQLARPGDTLVAPRGVAHSFRIESPQARLLVVTTGGDFEAAARALSRPAGGPGLPDFAPPSPEMIEALSRVMAAHRIDIIGPPIAA